jgi:hypothetical protein
MWDNGWTEIKDMGFVPEVTWGLHLKLEEAPAKGSVTANDTSIRPLLFNIPTYNVLNATSI